MDNSGIYVGLDIGTTSIKVIIAESVQGQLNIIGVGSDRSRGMNRGIVVDIDQVATSIQNAVHQAEQKANVSITNVYAGIPADMLSIEPCQGMIAVSDESKEITDQDVQNVAAAALIRNLPPEREIVDLVPDEFIVDGFDGIKDPRGMIGVRLEMHGIVFTSPKTVIHNIKKSIAKAGLNLKNLVVNPLALGKVALTDGEQDFGTILIDLGGGQSTAAVIHDHKLKFTQVDQEGGEYITKDISIVLNTSFENAEKLKRDYGDADVQAASDDEEFPVDIVGQNDSVMVSEKYLAEIIEARLEQILTRLGKSLAAVNAFDLPGGVVLTGGVTALPNIAKFAAELYHRGVKIYIPDQMGLRHPSFSQAFGLVTYVSQLSEVDVLVHSPISSASADYSQTMAQANAAKTTSYQTVAQPQQTVVEDQDPTPKTPQPEPKPKPEKKKKKRSEGFKRFLNNFFE
ncbi:cell division protein FtsA [Agrilactobacillus composti DSM 18527 = JCM 14202]|uniref:cell division protein FtsA n=1 Tax=Agrilactobacillus composti TaxID=398555 RepID=UPI00042E0B61|nr:cell division protein FtsA [Agrilactobacillus composti]GAF39016.1 cell division protein FtsA [Agrilactobacillus composti DSM 18527 = JCM 14202]